ncbi:OmpA family protein [Spiractinospora alimapuensis]|uniref:OmpA family protein n=1 Tax=Spiractinospora alimapuensis TaxID=2820884 RepID=UPI001F2452B8|nr:OmpA family protein [Spiractinospora alimapuensis]QVQ54420.1 OmpA family protein [Spiractinospora alimapuensis]
MHPSRGVPVAAALLTVSLALSGCGAISSLTSDDDAAESEGGGESGADTGEEAGEPGGALERPSVTERAIQGEREFTANVVAQRLDGDHMMVEFQMVNDSQETISIGQSYLNSQYADNSAYPKGNFSILSWFDRDESALQLPYHYSDRECVCSDTDERDNRRVEAGESLTLAAVMPAPPAEQSQVTIFSGLTAPFVNVPIEDDGTDLEMFGLEHPDEADVERETIRLESVIERADRSGSVVEDSEGTSFNLSTDVLFDTNESELTSEADSLIEDTADRIDAAGATDIKVEGHADDTGDDEINDPLSEERAEAVRDALDEYLDGVSYEIEGFGSREPLYDDTSEEAREQNRRVTISIPDSGEMSSSGDADSEVDTEADEEAEEDAPSSAGTGAGAPPEDFTADLSGSWANDPIQGELRLTGLTRIANDRAVLTYSITNTSDERIRVWGLLRDNSPRDTGGRNAEGARLTVPETGNTHLTTHAFVPEFGTGAECACTSLRGQLDGLDLEVTDEYYNLMSIDPEATTVDVQIGDAPPFEGVAVEG